MACGCALRSDGIDDVAELIACVSCIFGVRNGILHRWIISVFSCTILGV